MSLRFSLIAAVVAGGLYSLGFAPFDFWPATLAAMALWFYLLHSQPMRMALWASYAFGIGKYALGVSWIYVSIHDHGGASPALALFMVALFVAFIALFTLIHGALFFFARQRSLLINAWIFALAWLAGEWLQTWVLTGFPWLFAGYTQLATPLAALAPIGGVLLVGSVMAFVAALLCCLVRSDKRLLSGVQLAAVAVLVLVASAFTHTHAGAAFEVALVQGNIDQASKWQRGNRNRILRRHLDLSDAHWDADLIIWPEAAVTYYLFEAEPIFKELNRRSAEHGTSVLFGIPMVEDSKDGYIFHNTVAAAGDASGRYLKQRLVPFGEYVPLQSLLRGLIEFFDLPMSRMSEGPDGQPALRIGEHRAIAPICYEIAYPDLVADMARQADVDVLVTVSNDTWFGASAGPAQHLQMARMRAVELGRYLLRATNNGMTAVVAPDGSIVAQMPQFEAGVVRAEYAVMTGQTPFGRWGSQPWVLLALAGLSAGTYTRWRRGSRASAS
ncbi:MAG: apolipoprotein N-acyltransferase [Pseudomonadaceae bacterium]|nr:apolipoprotein N-acyltransferase [Pseudomonadaceae bacterium]